MDFRRTNMRWLCSDWDYRFKDPIERDGELTANEIIGSVQEAVGVGQPHCAIDDLPVPHRQLFQDTDFHFVGSRVFKKKDPIALAKDGDAGYDIVDADEDTKAEMMKEWASHPDVVQFLEEHGHELQRDVDPEDAMNFADERGMIDYAMAAPEQSDDETITIAISPLLSIDDDEDISDETEPVHLDLYEMLDTESLNSPFCGLGYRAPRDKYGFCGVERRSLWSENKARRDERFGDVMAEAKDLETEIDIDEFYERIRDDYYADKQIRTMWNAKAFQEDREMYLNSLWRQGLDQETIRRKLWAGFDRKECIVPAIIAKNGRIIRPRRKVKDSFWNKGRSEAMQDLVFTTSQWSKIYQELRRRREWCQTEGSLSTLGVLSKKISLQKNLEELSRLREDLLKQNPLLSRNHRSELWRQFGIRYKSLLTQQSRR